MTFNVSKLLLLVVCLLIAIMLLKTFNNGISKIITLAASLLLILYSLSSINPIIDFINTLSSKAGIDSGYLKIILKCVGICILGEFTSQLCKDQGENALAANSEFICKISILLLSLPMYTDIFNLVLKLWEN